MLHVWAVILTAFGYLLALFAVASYGDRMREGRSLRLSPYIYSLSLAVYCTTWTFFGSVGLASRSGLDFLAIYIGPALVMTLGFTLVRKVVRLSKEERITSIADFLASRYGKNLRVAAVATIILCIGTIPYIALQLKAISSSVSILVSQYQVGLQIDLPAFGDISILITVMLALFTILFGTRHADATEHQDGLILAVAMESIIKLAAFFAAGVFVTYFIYDGFGDLISAASNNGRVQSVYENGWFSSNFLVLLTLSTLVFLLLPRQFHVAVVENHSEAELEKARWLFPLYLVLINIFVVPISVAGLMKFGTTVNPDNFVLALPMSQDSTFIALFAFIGGLSAGTAMVVVACVALAIMISNDIVLPSYLRYRERRGMTEPQYMENLILNVRRTSILVILILAFIYYRASDDSAALASIGLVSFAAVTQLAPAFFIGLFWRRANSKGAMAGMITGTLIWAYTLLLPTLLNDTVPLLSEGLFGIAALKPQDLFGLGLEPIANGVFWSLLANTALFIFVSFYKSQDAIERVQATIFVKYSAGSHNSVRVGNTRATVDELTDTISRYLGEERTRRAFRGYWQNARIKPDTKRIVDPEILRFSEQLLASAIGASSSRLVHTLLLKRFDTASTDNIRLLDEASEALKYNQDVLQTALDQLDQGITVFDNNMRLASWNKQFRLMLALPSSIGQAGTSLSDIADTIVEANNLAEKDPHGENLAANLLNETEPWQLNLYDDELIIEIRTSTMPGGGLVVTWDDITERVIAADALRDANETLERRVEERTSDLMILNKKLDLARQEADQANASKTRFLAATGHDILQPLNAARLYSSTLSEKLAGSNEERLVRNISTSLESVEDILGAILAISRLDATRQEVKKSAFAIGNILEQMAVEFAPAAEEKGLELRFVNSGLWTRSDPALLRRLVQNLISNAIKYTREGKVLVGIKRRQDRMFIEVIDTGIGISDDAGKDIFGEFKRLEEGAREAPGLGLGLSIVERISKLLGHPVHMASILGKGTRFSIQLPVVPAELVSFEKKPARKAGLSTDLSGTRVFCIDNETSILEGMSGLLSQWGCEVSTATNLDSARTVFKDEGVPEIILADYHLENANGLDAIVALRDEFGSVPAVLVTADRSVELKEEAATINVSVLNKPVKPAQLRAMISHERKVSQAAE